MWSVGMACGLTVGRSAPAGLGGDGEQEEAYEEYGGRVCNVAGGGGRKIEEWSQCLKCICCTVVQSNLLPSTSLRNNFPHETPRSNHSNARMTNTTKITVSA